MHVAIFLFTEYKWCVRVELCFYSLSTQVVCAGCAVFLFTQYKWCVSLALFVFTEYKGFVLVEQILYGCNHRVHIGLHLMKYNFLSGLICVCI